MTTPTPEYLAANLAVGLGIAADAMIATVVRFRSFATMGSALRWAGAIGLTHWLFPMVGFVGGWYLAEGPGLRALVYGVGAVVMAWYVARVVRGALAPSDAGPGHALGLRGGRVFWLAVWTVSIDALVTGPGKTAITSHWSAAQIWLSFVLVGATVFVCVLAATALAVVIHGRVLRRERVDAGSIAASLTIGVALEVVVFTWFGCLALVESVRAMGQPVAVGWIWAASGLVVAAIGVSWGPRLLAGQRRLAASLAHGT